MTPSVPRNTGHAARFPFDFRITADDVMMQGNEFAGDVVVAARLDKDGVAGPVAEGDFLGRTAEIVTIGGPPIDLVIDEEAGRGAGSARPVLPADSCG